MKEKLYQYLLKQDKKCLYLKELKSDFTPIELASQLRALVSQEMVTIDWNQKKLWVRFDHQIVYLKKREITKYERETPDYMKSKAVNINEPYKG